MKKYISLIVILSLLGVAVVFLFYQQSKQVKQENLTAVIAQLDQITLLDNSLNLLLFRTHYGIEKSDEKIDDSVARIYSEFDYLTENDLVNAINVNQALSRLVDEYQSEWLDKVDLVENFKIKSARYRDTLQRLPLLGEEVVAAVDPNAKSVKADIEELNSAVYKYLLDDQDSQSKAAIQSGLAKLASYESSVFTEDNALVADYSTHLNTLLTIQQDAKRYLQSAVSSSTMGSLNKLSEAYTVYSEGLTYGSNTIKHTLLGYAALLLASLMFIAFALQRSYSSLLQHSTETKQAYEELQDSQVQLIQSDKKASLVHMVDGIADEITNPLANVTSNVVSLKNTLNSLKAPFDGLALLSQQVSVKPVDNKKITQLLINTITDYKKSNADDSYSKSIALLNRTGVGLDKINAHVKGIRAYTQYDNKGAEPVDIHACIGASLKKASSVLENNSVDVVQEYGVLPTINCVENQINQMFLNVIINAAQSMPRHNGTLTIKTEEINGAAAISFIDTGAGMEAEALERIFDPFYTTKNSDEASGLGMSIAYKIANNHGGDIRVKSVEKRGSVVTIELPID